MSSNIFAQYDQKDLNNIAAKGILEKIKVIRQKIKFELTIRRIIWELVQNAKDNASLCKFNNSTDVNIKMTLNENKFIFSHDNGYFTNDNIRALVRRSSSEDKEVESNPEAIKEKTTGRFGTGFMTTHVLSEKVQVQGLFQLDKDFKYFELLLDRSGKTKEEIIKSINNSFEQVEGFLNRPSKGYSRNELNTHFTYFLNSEGFEIVKQGLEDMIKTIGYVLINIPTIKQITVEDKDGVTNYKIKKNTISFFSPNNILFYDLVKNNDVIESFIQYKSNKVDITIPVVIKNSNVYIKKLEQDIPRLFLDFPLVGTEVLNLPYITNSHYFEPVETRDGVSLNYSNDIDTKNNKELVINAKNLYLELIKIIAQKRNFYDLYNLARIKNIEDRDWVSKYWFNNDIIKPIQEELLKIPVVETLRFGRHPIVKDSTTVHFLMIKNENELENFYNLCKSINFLILPIFEHVKIWSEIIWTDKYNFTLEMLCQIIEVIKTLNNLNKFWGNNNIEKTIDWLNQFYEFLNNNKYQSDRDLYLNQKGEFCKLKDLSFDENIDEVIKDIAEGCGINIRQKLLDKRVNIKHKEATLSEIAGQIESKIKAVWQTNDRNKYKNTMMNLFYWIRNNDNLAKSIFKDVYEKQFLLIDDQQLFDKVNKAEFLDEYLKEEGITIDEFKERFKKVKNKSEEKQNEEKYYEEIKDENRIRDEEFSKQFEEIDSNKFEKNQNNNIEFFIEGEDKTFATKLIEIIETLNSEWSGYIYHFTHVENAAKIINSKKLLPRSKANFLDSAGDGYITKTNPKIKDFVRFYFRPLTPTQYYNEGLGRETKLGDLPQCPVPIFLKFNIKEVLNKYKNKCFISNGNLWHFPQTSYGNGYEFLKKVNFKYLYNKYGSCDLENYLAASQQEFIIDGEFDFSDINDFEIICNHESDKETLLNLVEPNFKIIEKIKINTEYFYNYNKFVRVEKEKDNYNIIFDGMYKNECIKIELCHKGEKINLISLNSLIIDAKNDDLNMNIYYINHKNKEWLVFKNGNKNN